MSTVESSPSRTGRRRRATPPGFEESVQQADRRLGDRPPATDRSQAERRQAERLQAERLQAERLQAGRSAADRPHAEDRQAGRPRHPDPPIYLDLIARWTEAGRTLPGRRDPEWHRVASSPIWPSGPLYGG
ncbi:hypothetical protein [Streptomyces sp. Isolate_45]|uniref:hypothetical protein n=1 Tax=Streptomyces sp. Isolate_45 TaxID=2950111 RepID=UPI002481C57E|nr:hypothetical protein [Streptomyces sp. Isolate_45]MDA5280665.1 hypothetical protein [Streptomyces sp. Isolate_45]